MGTLTSKQLLGGEQRRRLREGVRAGAPELLDDRQITARGHGGGARAVRRRRDVEVEDLGGNGERCTGIRDIHDAADATLYRRGAQDGVGLSAGVTELLQV